MIDIFWTFAGIAAVWLLFPLLGRLYFLGRRYNGYTEAEWAELQARERKKAEKEVQGASPTLARSEKGGKIHLLDTK